MIQNLIRSLWGQKNPKVRVRNLSKVLCTSYMETIEQCKHTLSTSLSNLENLPFETKKFRMKGSIKSSLKINEVFFKDVTEV